MKRFILMLAIATLLFSCRKNKDISILYDVFALKNGVEWKAVSRCVMTKPDTIDIGADYDYNQNGPMTEDLFFGNILLSKGKQLLFKNIRSNRNYTAFYIVNGGDVLEGVYSPYADENNYIEIQQIDYCRKYIKGIFQVTFIADPSTKKSHPEFPDTIRFTNGTFTSYYKENIK